MEYYWPKLSEKGIDTGLIRIGYAHGLGNLLNAWARCYVYAVKKNNTQNIIAPTWLQFSLNQWRHNDTNKSLYTNLFTNRYYINEWRKQFILNTSINKVKIFEIHDLLKLDKVERISFGSKITDILGLSNSKVIIASKGSTFNKWASFLGRMPIIFPEKNFLNLYYDAPELELTLQKDEPIPENFLIEIKKVLDC